MNYAVIWSPIRSRSIAIPTQWLVTAACVAAVFLLWAFQWVVNDAINQGAQRRAQTLSHARDVWHCQAIPQAGERADCLNRLENQDRAQRAAHMPTP